MTTALRENGVIDISERSEHERLVRRQLQLIGEDPDRE